jgi:hypothetical protein
VNAGTDDPGWDRALIGLIPFFGLRAMRRTRPDGLTGLRSLLVGLISALFLFVVSLIYVIEDNDGGSRFAAFAVVGAAVLSHVAITLVARRHLSTASLRSLADSWRTRMFIGVGPAELPALVGFGLAIVSDALWVYLVGMVFALAGFWRIAPSKRNLARDQDTIRAAGSPLDLTEALMKVDLDAPQTA